jgi:hypothetical protein
MSKLLKRGWIQSKGMKKYPCANHKLAFGDINDPVAQNYSLMKCKRCGWWIKKYDRERAKRGFINRLLRGLEGGITRQSKYGTNKHN